MKRLLISFMVLSTFVVAAFAQDIPGKPNAYKDARTEFEKNEKMEDEKLTTQTIMVPEGFTEFYDKRLADELEANPQKYMLEDWKNSGGYIRIEYNPLYNEARIYYTTLMVHYDEGEVMNKMLAVLQDFCTLRQFTNSNGEVVIKDRYYKYNYLTPDKEKYFKEGKKKMAQYISYVKFSK